MYKAYQLIRNAGLKLTPIRKEIILIFEESPRPFTPREVQNLVQKRIGRCGLPGIYRNLEALAGCGVLFRLAGFGRERFYALCREPGTDPHHHHIVCVSCGKVAHVDGCRYHEGMMLGGYRLLSHIVQFEGVCANCQENN